MKHACGLRSGGPKAHSALGLTGKNCRWAIYHLRPFNAFSYQGFWTLKQQELEEQKTEVERKEGQSEEERKSALPPIVHFESVATEAQIYKHELVWILHIQSCARVYGWRFDLIFLKKKRFCHKWPAQWFYQCKICPHAISRDQLCPGFLMTIQICDLTGPLYRSIYDFLWAFMLQKQS